MEKVLFAQRPKLANGKEARETDLAKLFLYQLRIVARKALAAMGFDGLTEARYLILTS